MFGRRKDKAGNEGEGRPPVAPGQWLSDGEAEAVEALFRLTALPRAEFDATYGDLLRHCWRLIAKASGTGLDGTAGGRAPVRGRRLKVRQAHVLPRFAAGSRTRPKWRR